MSTSANSTDLESINEETVEIPDGNELVDVSQENTNKEATIVRKLSTFSKKYDVNGDGVLDEAEMAMRTMDRSGRGHLTNQQVYSMMQEQLETQKQLFRVRRIMFVLLGLVVILAVSNLGTSFAAASLAKDVTISSSAEITDKNTHEALSTQTTAEAIEVERVTFEPDGGRRLCDVDGDVECETNSFRMISESKCDAMINHCSRGNTVTLKRTWPNGDVTSFNVCPFKSGTISNMGMSKLKNSEGKSFFFEKLTGGTCRITGDAVAQEVDDICVVNGDCASLNCTKNSSRISDCKRRCDMLRFAASRLPACYASCDHATCHASAEIL
ncbi:hypothetical protein ACHAW5_008482 [Stephanodiscus triporus]|uniref:Calmodulin n=1 Tax=Stephanodiscus triporus TaxID=2934178 RepID=A0ABD3MLB9_9STRA